MGGKEALNLARRLEPLHDPISSAGRLMGVFGAVIEALVLPMLDPERLRRCTAKASTSGRQSLNFGFPQVVGNPATPNCSLTVIGTPSNGRRWPSASAASAAAA